jgi:hypothetical protein
MSWCRHYPSGGMGDNTHCKLGIEMQALRDASVVPHAFPCFTVGAEHLCAKYEPHTPEEIAEDERAINEFMKKADALWTRESEECPHCGKHVEGMHQTGRCVYAEPCGCRQGQGKLHSAWKVQS